MAHKIKSASKIESLTQLDQFDEVTAQDIEEARQSLGFTPSEMADALDWSPRKYSRALDAAREVDVVNRDFALAVRGVVVVRDRHRDGSQDMVDDGMFINGQTFESIFENLCKSESDWSARVAPHLLQLLAKRAKLGGSAISYGDAATTLEEQGLINRVWPRTPYGRPLGLICEALLELGEQTGERIPLISVIVTKAGGDPSYGIDGHLKNFIKLYEPKPVRKKKIAMLKQNRSEIIQELQQEALQYPHWPGVVRALLGSAN